MVGVVATTAFEDIADMLSETKHVGDGSYCKCDCGAALADLPPVGRSYCKCDCGAALADLPPVGRNASISQRK